MPLPTPHPGETQNDFVARCMKDPATQDITGANADEAQQRRVAACFRQFRAGKAAETEDVEAKALGPATITNAEQGQVEAIVATLGVVDRDADVIPLDAFPTGVKASISAYGHSSLMPGVTGLGSDEPPVGKGAIHIEGDKAVFRGQFFMETARGREAFLTTKAMGGDQEWSFGFRKLQVDPPSEELKAKGARRVLSKLAPMEVSPVTIAGGVGTRTLVTKAAEPETMTAAHAAQMEADASAKQVRELTDARDMGRWRRELGLKGGPATQSVGGSEHPKGDFAYTPGDMASDWKLPIFDEGHVRAALSRWNQTQMPDKGARATARGRLLAAAHRFNIDTAGFEKAYP
jgi:hypothetical protein